MSTDVNKTQRMSPNVTPMSRYLSLCAFLALVFAISALSSLVTMPAVTGWYKTINKPSWTPPDWVFGPVWTTLYIMIAVSGWRVWQRITGDVVTRIKHPALRFYWAQLALNFLWSFLFFAWWLPALAAVDILLMLAAIALTISAFRPIDKPAAWLLVPYLLWVSYASTLNIGIVILN
jgi:benzodiazapine receptor